MSPVDDGFIEYEPEVNEDKNDDPENFDNRRHSWEDEAVVVKRHSEQWNNNESRNGIVLNPSSIMDNDDRY